MAEPIHIQPWLAQLCEALEYSVSMVGEKQSITRRLLLVEDDQLTRGLISNLFTQSGFDVRSCGSAAEGATLAQKFDPDVMVVDISLGQGPTGIDLIHAMRNAYPHIAFVVLSNYAALPSAFKEFKQVAYLRKRDVADPQMLLQALEEVLHDFDPSERFPIEQQNVLSTLTKPQLEVLAFLAQGLSNHEIATRRGTTIQSTEQLIGRIYRSLGLERDSAKSLRVQATSIFNSITGASAGS